MALGDSVRIRMTEALAIGVVQSWACGFSACGRRPKRASREGPLSNVAPPNRRRLRERRLLAPLAVLVGALALGGSAPAEAADRVIHISVDGLNAGTLQTLMANDTAGDYANFQRLVDEGASTFNARTDYTHTNTLPNHVSMITGRPVEQPLGQPNTVHHGYTNNGDPGAGDTLHNAGNPNLSYVASSFDVAHDHGLLTGLYASKSKFVIFEQSYDGDSGAADPILPDDGTDKIDVYVNESTGTPANASNLHADFLTDMALAHYDYVWVHYRDPDSVGHASGWESAAYQAVLADIDGYLGDVLDLVETDPTLDGTTAIVLTSDHGGTGTSHIDATNPANYTVPFFVWGPGVATGAALYSLNASTRLDPGSGRPDYNAALQPIRNGDSGNLALQMLGLPAVEGSTINSSQDLSVGPSDSVAVPTASGWAGIAVAMLLLAAGALALTQRRPARA